MDGVATLPFADRGFQLVAAATLLLLLCAVAFTLVTGWLRTQAIRERRRWERLERQWEPTTLAVLAGDESTGSLRALVHGRDERRFVSFLLRFARQLKGPEAEAVRQLAAPHLHQIAADLHHRNAEHRARALQTLGELSVAMYSDQFLQALKDPSTLVAMSAAQALSREYDPAYAEQLLDALARFDQWSVNYLAALLSTMGPESAEALRGALGDTSRPPRVRAVVAATLTALNDVESVDVARRVIEAEDQVDLVVRCLRLVEKLGADDQLPAVRSLLMSPEPGIRARALRTLARIGGSDDADRIKAGLTDESNWVVLHAVRGLSELGETELLEDIAASEHGAAEAARELLWEGSA